MIPFLNVLQYLVLTMWVGAMFGFATLYAPVLFRSLTSREQAGSIAGETLARVDSVGLVASGILIVVTALQAIGSGWSSLDLGRFLAAVTMLVLVLISSITIRQKLSGIRADMGRPIDDLPAEDPLRKEHRKFHMISQSLYTINLILGLLLIVLSALRA